VPPTSLKRSNTAVSTARRSEKRGRSSFIGMPRRPRICPAGVCFHVLNRAVARLRLFEKREDYEAFERVLSEAFERYSLPIFAYCVMPNHWHFVVRPQTDTQLSECFRWLSTPTRCGGTPTTIRKAPDTFIKDDSRRLRSKKTITSWRCYDMWNAIRCERTSVSGRRIGSIAVRGGWPTEPGNCWHRGRFRGLSIGDHS